LQQAAFSSTKPPLRGFGRAKKDTTGTPAQAGIEERGSSDRAGSP
jgi:hypothetical protein